MTHKTICLQGDTLAGALAQVKPLAAAKESRVARRSASLGRRGVDSNVSGTVSGVRLRTNSLLLEVRMHSAKSALAAILLVYCTPTAFGQCVHAGGGIITNVGVISADRTLGTATGSLKGAVGVQIVGQSPGPNGATVLSVHHYWVTDEGDTIFVDPALLTAVPVAPGLFAVVTYPVSISGGTGKFKGATGQLNVIGEADFNAGTSAFRYSGQVCFADSHDE